jgi:hypothetical protein
MTELVGAAHLLRDDDLRAVDALPPADVLVGVCALNQARSAAGVVAAASAGLATALADRKGAVVVVEAGFRSETLDAVKSWMAARAPEAPVCCVRLTGPPRRSRALLGALAIAHRLGSAVAVLVDAGLISLTPEGFGCLARPILAETADCVSPAYTHTVAEGTLTTNLLAPMCRALYGRRVQQLLGACAALSQRVVARLLESEAWGGDLTDHAVEIGLTIDALTSGDRVVEVHLGRKVLDTGLAPPDLATTLAHTVGPFFRLMDRYRGVWSEVTGSTAVPLIGDPPALLPETGDVAVERMVRAFKLGLKDLLPIWEQALQEETLSSFYPLGLLSADEFAFPAEHWARVAFDFAVAYHEQRLPRDHLLRALTPLYLGRVAAFLREVQVQPVARIPAAVEAIGRAFEIEKAALVTRWR